jgi:hypothetical protein
MIREQGANQVEETGTKLVSIYQLDSNTWTSKVYSLLLKTEPIQKSYGRFLFQTQLQVRQELITMMTEKEICYVNKPISKFS